MTKKTSVNLHKGLINLMYIGSIVLFLIFIGFTRQEAGSTSIMDGNTFFTKGVIENILFFLVPGLALFIGADFLGRKNSDNQ
ncbi:MAG: hypothetical protein VZT48_10855 [Bulleidia sp.]|nr:hypothetical protein [Bulleidia sp.]